MNPDEALTESEPAPPPKKPRPGYDEERIDKLFGHTKLGPDELEEFFDIKEEFRLFAHRVFQKVPKGPLQTVALNTLLKAKDEAVRAYIDSLPPRQENPA